MLLVPTGLIQHQDLHLARLAHRVCSVPLDWARLRVQRAIFQVEIASIVSSVSRDRTAPSIRRHQLLARQAKHAMSLPGIQFRAHLDITLSRAIWFALNAPPACIVLLLLFRHLNARRDRFRWQDRPRVRFALPDLRAVRPVVGIAPWSQAIHHLRLMPSYAARQLTVPVTLQEYRCVGVAAEPGRILGAIRVTVWRVRLEWSV